MVLVAYDGPVSPAARLRKLRSGHSLRVLYLPTDIHWLLVNKRSSSYSSSHSLVASSTTNA
jgi:hypothetical protein